MQKYLSLSGGSHRARLKLLGYYAQRVCTNRLLRRVGTRALVAGLGALHGRADRAGVPDASVASMRAQGYLRLSQLLSPAQCSEILAWLAPLPMIATRGNGEAFTLDALPAPAPRMGDYPLDTVVNCPHVLALANRPDILALAGAYLGYTPVITLMGLRWSFPAEGADADVQHFHRDVEPGSIKLLVYLTDVDDASGPHHYVPRSHLDRMPLRMQRYSDHAVAQRHGGSVSITGPAGTAIAIDNKGIHKGAPPRRQRRLLLVIQYSLLPCLMYEYAPVPYAGQAPVDPYINRLMVAPRPA